MKQNKKISKERLFLRVLPLLAFCAALFWLWYQIYPVIFATHDDMRNYTLVRRGMLLLDAWQSSRNGRISHLWNHPLLGAPFLANRVWFYKAVSYGAYLFDILAGWLLLRTHVSKRFAALAAVLTVSWTCLSYAHSPLVAYAFCHQIPAGLLFLSLWFFGNYMQKKRRRDCVLSCICLLPACMIYEAFTAALLLFLLWAMMRQPQENKSYLRWLCGSFLQILPQLLTVLAYVLVYLIWQRFYPPFYDGTKLDLEEPVMSLYTVGAYALCAFPPTELFRLAEETPMTLGQLLKHLQHPAAWVCAVLTSAAFAVLLPRIRMQRETRGRVMLLSGTGALVLCILIGFSEKYIRWMRMGVNGYLPSFYSFLLLSVFLSMLLLTVYRAVPKGYQRKTAHAVLTALVFGICLMSSAVTDISLPDYLANSLRYRNFDYAVSSAEFTACDASWQVYAPDNLGIHHRKDYTEDYLKIYNPAQVDYITDAAALNPEKQILCMRMPVNYAYAVIGAADETLCAETLTFRTLVPEPFDLTLQTSDGETVTFAAVRDGDTLTAPAGTAFDLQVRVSGDVS